jgi:hypothetical protein
VGGLRKCEKQQFSFYSELAEIGAFIIAQTSSRNGPLITNQRLRINVMVVMKCVDSTRLTLACYRASRLVLVESVVVARVALACDHFWAEYSVNLGQVLGAELDILGGVVLIKMRRIRRTCQNRKSARLPPALERTANYPVWG